MKRYILFALFCFVAGAAFGQYPANPNKIRLGNQTSGDGLVYRGSGAPAYTPSDYKNAWVYIDSVAGRMYTYRGGAWEFVSAGAGVDSTAFRNDSLFVYSPDTTFYVVIDRTITVAGSAGTPQTVDPGQTVTIAAGNGVTTTAGATRTVTVAADTSVLASKVYAESLVNESEITVTQADHVFFPGNLVHYSETATVFADFGQESTLANAIIKEVVNDSTFIIQTSGQIEIPNITAGTTYYTGARGYAVTEAPKRKHVAYRAVEDGLAELVFGPAEYPTPTRYTYMQKVQDIAPDNLIAYWPLDDASGTSAREVKNGYNGTYSGTPDLTQSGFGDGLTSLYLDGSNDYVTLPSGFASSFVPDDGTVSVWVKLDSAAAVDASVNTVFWFDTKPPETRTFFLRKSTDRAWQVGAAGGVTGLGTPTDEWTHIAVTWSSKNNSITCYVNGENANFWAEVPNTVDSVFNQDRVNIGQLYAGTNRFKGYMAHFSIFDRALNYGEVLELAGIQNTRNDKQEVFQTDSIKSIIKTLSSTGEPNWVGRPSIVNLDSIWVMAYRRGGEHNSGTGINHIVFSDDEGVTWSKQDTLLDGTTPLSGAPFTLHGTNINSSGGDIFSCSNGDIIFHQWESGNDPLYQGTYQYRSTDGGETWTDEGRLFNNSKFVFEEDHTIISDTIYVIGRDVTVSLEKTIIIYSFDNATTWDTLSYVETEIDANETGIEHVGGGVMIAVARTSTRDETYQYRSDDYGRTWSEKIAKGYELGIVQKPRLKLIRDTLFLIGREVRDLDYWETYTSVWFSVDTGDTWSPAFRPDQTYYFEETGYCDIEGRTDGSFYLATYAGRTGNADLREYVFSYKQEDTLEINKLISTLSSGFLKSTGVGTPVSVSSSINLQTEVSGVLPKASGGNPLAGLTDNYIPRADGTDDLENSVLRDDGSGNVGLGITPEATLHILRGTEVSGSISSLAAALIVEQGVSDMTVAFNAGPSHKIDLVFGDNVASSSGKIRYYNTSHANTKKLSFYTNLTAKMTIDTLGRVQIGNNIPETPEARLHLYEGNVANTPKSEASLVIEKNSDDGGINILTNSVRRGAIYFGDNTNNTLGWIAMKGSTMTAPASAFEFLVGGSVKGFWGPTGMLSVGTMTTFTDAMGVINAQTGYRVNNLATSGEFLRGNGTNFVSSAIQSSDIPNASISTAKLATGAVSGSAYGTIYYVPVDSINYDATTDLATYSEIHYYMYTGAGATANQVLTIPAASISYAGKKVYVVSDDADGLDAYTATITSASGSTIRYYSGGDTGMSDNASYAFAQGEGSNAVLLACMQHPRTLAYRWVVYDGVRTGY